MLARLHKRLTFANIVSLVALFVALGGSSYAAVTLQKNSVLSKHIKDGQVTTKDVKNASLLAQDFKPGQLPQGERGAAGERGLRGEQGPQGPGAVRINLTRVAATTQPTATPPEVARVGPWTIRALCFSLASGVTDDTRVLVYAEGPGEAQYAGLRWTGANPGPYPHSFDRALSESEIGEVFQSYAITSGNYTRLAGDLQLHSSSRTASVSLSGIVDRRDGRNECSLRGTAVVAA